MNEEIQTGAIWFREHSITTKEEIQEEVERIIRVIETNSIQDMKHSAAYYHAAIDLFKRFQKKLENTLLFHDLEDWWCYTVVPSYDGIFLTCDHYEFMGMLEDGTVGAQPDQELVILGVESKLLSVEEYANLYGVETVTIRQWIRRGKIRTAKKLGSEWRIPILTEPPERGYTSASYEWDEELEDIPAEYKFLKDYTGISIHQDTNEKANYYINLFGDDEPLPQKEEILDEKQRAKLEIFLIAHPQIRYTQKFFESLLKDIYPLEQYEGDDLFEE